MPHHHPCPSPLRIAVDVRRISNPGIGHYMAYLFPAMLAQQREHEFLFVGTPDWRDERFARPNARTINSPIPYYSIREQAALPRLLRRERVGLFHSPHFLLPALRPCKSIVTIHDAIYLAFKGDLHGAAARLYYPLAFRLGARRAHHIITDSAFSKREIVRLVGVRPERITVIPLAADASFRPIANRAALDRVRATYHLPERFFLYVGITRHRKNIPAIIRAFHQVLQSGAPDLHLVLAGKHDPRYREIPALVTALGLEGRVHFPGYVPDADLPALLNLATAFVFPSLYEGFGLPVLEAMACGTPVITSTTTSLPEVAGDAALLVDPTDVGAIARAMARLADHPAEARQWRARGLARAARFSWEETAARTLAVYEEVSRAA